MFKLLKCMNGRQSVGEPALLPATPGETYAFGEALVLSAGKLTKCGPTAKPTHICGVNYVAPATDPEAIPCVAVAPNMVFETVIGAAPASLTVGVVVTLSADALGVTATTTSGVATIHNLLGATAAGDAVEVVFK